MKQPLSRVSSSLLQQTVKLKVSELRWVIFPDNRLIQIWDQFIMFLLLILAFTIPFTLGVVSRGSNESLENFIIGLLVNLVFVVDTVLIFFKAYVDGDGKLVVFRSTIARRYLTSWFVVDVLACFPSDVILYATRGTDADLRWLRVFEILRLLRLARARRILKNASWWKRITLRTSSVVISGFKYLFGLIILNHWFACLWCLVALLEAGSFRLEKIEATPNWIRKYIDSAAIVDGSAAIDPTEESVAGTFARYVLALYWSVMTVTSIGYGDITPESVAEFWIVSVIMLLGGIMWAYIIGSAVTIASQVNEETDQFNSEMDSVNLVIRKVPDMSKDTAESLRSFLHSRYVNQNKEIRVQQEVLPLLSRSLQVELQKNTYRKVLSEVGMFQCLLGETEDENAQQQALLALFEGIRIEYYAKDDLVQNVYERGIRVVKEGVIATTSGRPNSSNRHLLVADCSYVFGEEGVFLSDTSPLLLKSTMRTLVYTEIFFIPRTVVLQVASTYPPVWKYGRWLVARCALRDWAHRSQAVQPSGIDKDPAKEEGGAKSGGKDEDREQV